MKVPKISTKMFIFPFHQLPNNSRRVQFQKDAETEPQRSQNKLPQAKESDWVFQPCIFEEKNSQKSQAEKRPSCLCLNDHLYRVNSPFWMLQNRNHQFHGQGSCNHGQSWAAHSTLLVQGPVSGWLEEKSLMCAQSFSPLNCAVWSSD